MNSASIFQPADWMKSPSISEKPISRKIDLIISIRAIIGCGRPPEGVGAGAFTSNGLNSTSRQSSLCSSSGVTSPIIRTSLSSEASALLPFLVRVHVLETLSSRTISPFLPEK